jgi:tRNA(fMet)-specific endonuclease VapC
MTHLLDSNACIELLRNPVSSPVSIRVQAAPLGSVVVCSIVVAELLFGALRSKDPSKTWPQVVAFLSQFVSLPGDDKAAEHYARIKAHLAAIGQPIGPNDLHIAAIARANGLTLVTHNTAEFGRVPGLAIEDWQVP